MASDLCPVVQPVDQGFGVIQQRDSERMRIHRAKCPHLKRCYAARRIYFYFYEAKIMPIQAFAAAGFPELRIARKNIRLRDD